ncbi:hypothetical protein SEVIR_9G052666v4 [Setaria viridis]
MLDCLTRSWKHFGRQGRSTCCGARSANLSTGAQGQGGRGCSSELALATWRMAGKGEAPHGSWDGPNTRALSPFGSAGSRPRRRRWYTHVDRRTHAHPADEMGAAVRPEDYGNLRRRRRNTRPRGARVLWALAGGWGVRVRDREEIGRR